MTDTIMHDVRVQDGRQSFGSYGHEILLKPRGDVSEDEHFIMQSMRSHCNLVSVLDPEDALDVNMMHRLSILDDHVLRSGFEGSFFFGTATTGRDDLFNALETFVGDFHEEGDKEFGTSLARSFAKAIRNDIVETLLRVDGVIDLNDSMSFHLSHSSAESQPMSFLHQWHADFCRSQYIRVHRSLTLGGMNVAVPGEVRERLQERDRNQRRYDVSEAVNLPTGLSVFNLEVQGTDPALCDVTVHNAEAISCSEFRTGYFLTGAPKL